MTLDKAIEEYKFWANAHERDAEYHRPLGYAHESIANVAEKQAREERQIAEWLKELKAYRETYPYGVEGYPPRAEPSDSEKPNDCDTCRNKGFEGCEQPCLGCGCCDFYAPKDEPQFDKDINVRSKDEPFDKPSECLGCVETEPKRCSLSGLPYSECADIECASCEHYIRIANQVKEEQ